MLPEGTSVKNSGGHYREELRFLLPLINEVLRNGASADLFPFLAPISQLWSFLPNKDTQMLEVSEYPQLLSLGAGNRKGSKSANLGR